MDFPFLVALLVTLLLANRTNNVRLLLFVVPLAQHLPPSGTYSIDVWVCNSLQTWKNVGILEVFYRGVCSTHRQNNFTVILIIHQVKSVLFI